MNVEATREAKDFIRDTVRQTITDIFLDRTSFDCVQIVDFITDIVKEANINDRDGAHSLYDYIYDIVVQEISLRECQVRFENGVLTHTDQSGYMTHHKIPVAPCNMTYDPATQTFTHINNVGYQSTFFFPVDYSAVDGCRLDYNEETRELTHRSFDREIQIALLPEFRPEGFFAAVEAYAKLDKGSEDGDDLPGWANTDRFAKSLVAKMQYMMDMIQHLQATVDSQQERLEEAGLV